MYRYTLCRTCSVAYLSLAAFSASVSSGLEVFLFLLLAFFLVSASLSLLLLLLLPLLLLLLLKLRALCLGASLPFSLSFAGALVFVGSLDLDLLCRLLRFSGVLRDDRCLSREVARFLLGEGDLRLKSLAPSLLSTLCCLLCLLSLSPRSYLLSSLSARLLCLLGCRELGLSSCLSLLSLLKCKTNTAQGTAGGAHLRLEGSVVLDVTCRCLTVKPSVGDC